MKVLDTFGIGNATAAGGTAFRALIPPRLGSANAGPLVYGKRSGSTIPNWWTPSAGLTRITSLVYTTGATAHTIGIMRPLNFTYTTAVAAAGQAVIAVETDPGLYATTYKYKTGGGFAPRVANNGIAGSDVVVYQAKDGSWVLDTVASVSSLNVTLTTNLPTGGVLAGAVVFFFGVVGDTDPANGLGNFQIAVPASQTLKEFTDPNGIFQALHVGDPLVFYSPNTTNAGVLDRLAIQYAA